MCFCFYRCAMLYSEWSIRDYWCINNETTLLILSCANSNISCTDILLLWRSFFLNWYSHLVTYSRCSRFLFSLLFWTRLFVCTLIFHSFCCSCFTLILYFDIFLPLSPAIRFSLWNKDQTNACCARKPDPQLNWSAREDLRPKLKVVFLMFKE